MNVCKISEGDDWMQPAKKLFHWQCSFNVVMKILARLSCITCATDISAFTVVF